MGARSYRASRSIDAPATTVWSLLTNTAAYPEWNKAVISIEGSMEHGNTIKLVSIADPKRTFKLKVTEMHAPDRMVWSDGMPLGLFTGRRTYTIASDGDDRCEFVMIEAFTGPLAGLITRAIPDLSDSFNIFADSLKSAAETRRAAATPNGRMTDGCR